MQIDLKLSKELSQDVRMGCGFCYWNVVDVLKAHPDIRRQTQYTEGYHASAELGIICHGWLQQDDRIIDPTPGFADMNQAGYFPLASYPYHRVYRATLATLPKSNLINRRDEKVRTCLYQAALKFMELTGRPITDELKSALRKSPPMPFGGIAGHVITVDQWWDRQLQLKTSRSLTDGLF